MSVGRGVFWKKSTVEESLSLDMKNFARDVDLTSYATGYSSWKSSFGKEDRIGWKVNPYRSIRLQYTTTKISGEKKEHDYEVLIETTPCNYGGERWWFLCPVCFRRCRILYQPPSQSVFACRICHNLSYQSQQEGKNYSSMIVDAVLNLPAWERQLRSTRSPRKRQKLLDMINKYAGSLMFFERQTKATMRKLRKKKNK